jgi:DNA repair protein RecN (Recombination protein N)
MALPHVAELSVKDLALVSELRLRLEPGLTVLTGETGAGKSMLVDALLCVSGGRAASGMVRELRANAKAWKGKQK